MPSFPTGFFGSQSLVTRVLAAVALASATLAVAAPRSAHAQQAAADSSVRTDTTPAKRVAPAPKKQWYERLSIRGYTQIRYNNLFMTNPDLTCPQCDRSIGQNGGIFIRRARLVISGDVSDRVYVYIQPDFATEVSGNQNFGQLRDAYFDLALDPKKEFRLRFGQSKVPFGWANLQSSSNRVPFDRDDAMNSSGNGERDLGVFLMWAPAKIRERFRILIDSGLKGSGDYGVISSGAYNGQGLNKPEANDNLHSVLRVTYPFRLSNGQFVEVGVQGYSGLYVLPSRSTGLNAPTEFDDSRFAASFVYYPQPFGLQAEWTTGRGPEFNPTTSETRVHSLNGGYLMAMYRIRTKHQTIIPYVRGQRYDGGKKFELDARKYRVREFEGGIEWLPIPAMELTAAYVNSNRTYEDLANPTNHQKGQMLRLQAQFNY